MLLKTQCQVIGRHDPLDALASVSGRGQRDPRGERPREQPRSHRAAVLSRWQPALSTPPPGSGPRWPSARTRFRAAGRGVLHGLKFDAELNGLNAAEKGGGGAALSPTLPSREFPRGCSGPGSAFVPESHSQSEDTGALSRCMFKLRSLQPRELSGANAGAPCGKPSRVL